VIIVAETIYFAGTVCLYGDSQKPCSPPGTRAQEHALDAPFWRLTDGHGHEQSRTLTCPLPNPTVGYQKDCETPSGAAFEGIRRHEDDEVDESRDCLSSCFEIHLLFRTVRVWKPVRLIAWCTWTTTCGEHISLFSFFRSHLRITMLMSNDKISLLSKGKTDTSGPWCCAAKTPHMRPVFGDRQNSCRTCAWIWQMVTKDRFLALFFDGLPCWFWRSTVLILTVPVWVIVAISNELSDTHSILVNATLSSTTEWLLSPTAILIRPPTQPWSAWLPKVCEDLATQRPIQARPSIHYW
jgi:hypothetical protein